MTITRPPAIIDAHFDEDASRAIAAAVSESRRCSEDNEVVAGPVPLGAGAFASRRILAHGVLAPHAVDEDVWFFGDLHGDLLAFEAGLHHISRTADSARRVVIVLLGDLVDDEGDAYPLVIRVLRLLQRPSPHVVMLAGNHDEALTYEAERVRFRSGVSPGDFADWLNARIDCELPREVGKMFVEVVENAPRAIFFPEGLMASHGGFPHSDLLSALSSPSDLGKDEMLSDFVWTRAHRHQRKRPNRASHGCQYGYLNFHEFCSTARALGLNVDRIVRGHDHEVERFRFLEPYPLLTINSLSHRLPREGGAWVRSPVIARRTVDGVPEVHRLVLSDELVNAVYPEPSRAVVSTTPIEIRDPLPVTPAMPPTQMVSPPAIEPAFAIEPDRERQAPAVVAARVDAAFSGAARSGPAGQDEPVSSEQRMPPDKGKPASRNGATVGWLMLSFALAIFVARSIERIDEDR